jgi:cell division protein FtsB
MKVLAGIIIALILAIQYPLWLGKGSWLRVAEVDRRLSDQRSVNERLERRNNALGAEVRDLKQGFEAIEERARFELGMVKPDEVFFQILEAPRTVPPATGAAQPLSKP